MTTVEQKLAQLLKDDSGSTDHDVESFEHFRTWFLQQFNRSLCSSCNLEEFAVYFLNAIRQQTEIHLRVHESDTPKCQTPIRTPLMATSAGANASLTPKRLLLGQHNTTSMLAFQSSLEAHNDDSLSILQLDDSLCTSLDRSFAQSLQSNTSTSTPVRRTPTNQLHPRRSGHNFHTTTPSSGEKQQQRNSSASSSLCLGDFLVMNSSSRSNKKKTPQHVDNSSTPTGKPKKRVVPTTISNRQSAGGVSAPFGSSGSSFSNENNILKVSYSEIDDKNKCSIMEARKSLRVNASEISRELGAIVVTAQQSVMTKKALDAASDAVSAANALESAETQSPIDLEKVTDRAVLQRLADIYAVLIDLNFTTNVLNEVSFLLNLLNANDTQQCATVAVTEQIEALQLAEDTGSPSNELLKSSGFSALRNFTNCVYFACRVLEQQRQFLALLDLKSLGVVLNNERIAYLANDMKSFLDGVYQQKQQVEAHRSRHDTSIRFDTSFKNVYYQEDKDSRQHFPSNNEFSAFKTQRDLFCRTLKLWQANHLNSAWSFGADITPKIREIFKQSEHPVNMAHFAKLFVSQLLISSSDATSPEEIGIEMDLQKFSKLTQRLVAPSNFSVDYQFPRNQAFFRDFVSEARCISFAEQLKIALYSELITLNDSSFEQLQLATTPDNDDDDEETVSHGYNEFTVHPEVLASMLILAKFLGYVTAQPFSEHLGASMAVNVEKKQIMLRNLFQPNFNICSLLEKATQNGKLLITLPWMVQFLVMLDNVTLQLDTFAEAMQVIFALYMNLGMGGNTQLMPTSVFIVRCCLGWLFETKPIIAEQYYAYRAMRSQRISAPQKNDEQEIRFMISNHLASELPTSTPLHISSVKRAVHDGTYTCVLQSPSVLTREEMATPSPAPRPALQLNPILESVLNVACPFLADFRVSIMPAKYALTKYVSRTGRYRHITTRLAELPSPIRSETETNNLTANSTISQNSQQKSQTKLVDAFLHSQNSSMRRLIEFVIERAYKSVVKDAQHSILLPSKSAADSKVNGITSCNAAVVLRSVASIYNSAREEARQQWDANVSRMIHERVEKALDALLPAETAPIIRKTYCNLIVRNTAHKVHQWRYVNMIKTNFYCSDLDEVTQKICKANKKERQAAAVSSELKIVKAVPSVSDLIDELQYWLHCTSMRPDLLLNVTPVIEFLHCLPLAFENTLPTICYRLIGAGVVQLLQHIIARHPLYMTPNLLDAACSVWLTPEMQNAISHARPVERDDDIVPPLDDDDNGTLLAPAEVPSIYGGLITISFIESLGTQRICFDKLGEFLSEIINQCVATVDFVNMLFVPILKVDWHPNVLNEISNMLQTIVKETGGGFGQDDGVKSRLFMEVLADMSRNVDF